jgi:CheY-like chemotaxis protein
LQLAGHETYKAHDGVEAIEAARQLRPDAVLLDIGLPRLNGYEVCRRIRKEPWGADLVLVALTGWGGEEDRRQSDEAGFDAHMVKPVDHDALLRLLASLPTVKNTSSPVSP